MRVGPTFVHAQWATLLLMRARILPDGTTQMFMCHILSLIYMRIANFPLPMVQLLRIAGDPVCAIRVAPPFVRAHLTYEYLTFVHAHWT
jgi:hypothetical protein